jgi:hypothetical protein
MIEARVGSLAVSSHDLALLTKEFRARLLNFSAAGCLVETNTRLEIGTVGSLRFVFDGTEFVDDVQVVRCQQIEGAGALYQVGARFLWTSATGRGTLRQVLERPHQQPQSASTHRTI